MTYLALSATVRYRSMHDRAQLLGGVAVEASGAILKAQTAKADEVTDAHVA
jgi:hypothetical protein